MEGSGCCVGVLCDSRKGISSIRDVGGRGGKSYAVLSLAHEIDDVFRSGEIGDVYDHMPLPTFFDIRGIPQWEREIVALSKNDSFRTHCEGVGGKFKCVASPRAVVVIVVLGEHQSRKPECAERHSGNPDGSLPEFLDGGFACYPHPEGYPYREGHERTEEGIVALTRFSRRLVEIDHNCAPRHQEHHRHCRHYPSATLASFH